MPSRKEKREATEKKRTEMVHKIIDEIADSLKKTKSPIEAARAADSLIGRMIKESPQDKVLITQAGQRAAEKYKAAVDKTVAEE